ncbi:hypothetical protein H8S90_01795 [Olivibacter sp. SDN3]|uniref:hypothetical protein n=1 Tax=Olivibacter sp. SDN3 TaxID=2764720 RepID=UPI0016517A45|nr:hypothetical protein [Olivibacter sp. SDN3]QNL50386.1 hypothetical protein H8S90_01795 [Olivibacter sp. SDN3]
MIKKALLLGVLIFSLQQAVAQKIFVWCPPSAELTPNNDKLKGLNINIVLSDARIITDSTRVECSSQDLLDIVANTIVTNYPAAIINILDTNQYRAEAQKEKITVRIGVSAYHSASGNDVSTAIGNAGGNFNWGALPKNKWNSVAGFHVVIEDYRTNELKTLTRDIANIVSRPNIGGALTAKKALFEAYKEAHRELLYFIESIF